MAVCHLDAAPPMAQHVRGMSARLRARMAWSGFGTSVLLIACSLGLVATHPQGVLVPVLLLMAGALSYSCVGALVAVRQPANRIGWLLLATGLLSSLSLGVSSYGFAALAIAPGALPAGIWAAWTFKWLIWLVLVAIPFALLIFPDGRPPSGRWWIVGTVLIASGGLLALLTMLAPGPIVIPPDTAAIGTNPAGLGMLAGVEDHFFRPINEIYLAAVLASGAAPIWRFHRSGREERQQLKVLAYIGAWIVALQVVTYATPLSRMPGVSDLLWSLSFAGLAVGLPAAYAVAILRYRLYDIDVVINRTLVFTGLAVFVTGTYVVIVAGAGALIGSASRPSLALSILATAVVAVAFQPVRQRAQALANRLVYGGRVDPREVLSRLSNMVADTNSGEQVLTRTLQMLVESTSVTAAAIYLDIGAERVLAASWPEGAASITGRALPIRHQGDEIGQLVVAEPQEALAPDTDRLLSDIAGQAGLLMRNQRLTAELQARVEELAESRLRIVAAQDAERRRLERDIHDGVQQHVVALMAKLQLARNQVRRRSEVAASTPAKCRRTPAACSMNCASWRAASTRLSSPMPGWWRRCVLGPTVYR